MPHNSGMDWIRLAKRMAVYLRDGFDCVWCRGVFPVCEKGYGLTLDHVHPSGGNEPHNLVTACHSCNSKRQATPLLEWLQRLEEELGWSQVEVAHRALVAMAKPLDMREGHRLAKARRPQRVEAAQAAE